VGSLDLSPDPEGADKPELAEVGGGGRRRAAREMPDPEERGRVYDAALAYANADAGAAAGSGADSMADGQRYWAEVPRFLRMWADHVERWPEEQRTGTAVDRSPDPPGSYRSDGGFYLSPDRNDESDEGIDRVRQAETSISAAIRSVEQDNTAGAWLEGFECRLKGDDRLKEKIAEALTTSSPDATPADVLQQIPDAIRYTFCLSPDRYATGYYEIKEQLESSGYEMYRSKNSWTTAEYKGINTRWATPDGQQFEAQFHTADSFHAKQEITHGSYERIRNPLTSRPELVELHTFQREVSSRIQVPDDAAEIPDYKKEGL
jgi:hypothetical protein